METLPRAAKYSSGISVPLDLVIVDHVRLCMKTVYDWGLHSVANSVPPPPVKSGTLVQKICDSLGKKLPSSAATEPGAHYARRLLLLHQLSRRLLGWSDTAFRLGRPCPRCGLRSLCVSIDRTVTCSYCHVSWTSEEWRAVDEQPG